LVIVVELISIYPIEARLSTSCEAAVRTKPKARLCEDNDILAESSSATWVNIRAARRAAR
jgi:hypothetical protein